MRQGQVHQMRDYAISLIIGLGVGLVYGLLRFRSPAPPLIALVGLLGMLAGEQIVARARNGGAAPPNLDAPKPSPPPAPEP
jgi:XapX domain-containing protein